MLNTFGETAQILWLLRVFLVRRNVLVPSAYQPGVERALDAPAGNSLQAN